MTAGEPGLARKLLIGCAVLLMSVAAAASPTLRIAAAADLAPCIQELNNAFAEEAGRADLSYSIGASGNFFAQIKNGAPYDVFLSADLRYPQELAKAGLADAATLMVYAHGQLVMWTNDSHIDISKGFVALNAPVVRHIAIANPEVAPYGRAAKAALERAGMWDSIQSKLVVGESVAQTVQFVESGNAQVGFISVAHVRASQKGKAWTVPANLYPLIEQAAVVTIKGKGNPLALRYLGFLQSKKGRMILQSHGFVLPDKRD